MFLFYFFSATKQKIINLPGENVIYYHGCIYFQKLFNLNAKFKDVVLKYKNNTGIHIKKNDDFMKETMKKKIFFLEQLAHYRIKKTDEKIY